MKLNRTDFQFEIRKQLYLTRFHFFKCVLNRVFLPIDFKSYQWKLEV